MIISQVAPYEYRSTEFYDDMTIEIPDKISGVGWFLQSVTSLNKSIE